MRDAEQVLAEAGVDPVVVALALALAARRPVSVFSASSAGDGVAFYGAPSSGTVAARSAYARAPRPKNRKG